MAFDVTALTAYIEDRDFPLVAKLQFDPELKAAKATIQDGIKGSSNLHFMETSVEFQVDDCTRSASGTTTFSDKTITVGKIAIAEDLCMDDLENKWTQILLKKGVMEGREAIPAEIAAIYMEEKMVKYKQAIAVADWRGDTGSGTANLNKYDGWIKFIDAMFLSYDSNYVVGMDADSDGDFTSRVDPVTLKKVLVDSNFRRGTQIQFVEDVVEFTLVP